MVGSGALMYWVQQTAAAVAARFVVEADASL